MTPVFRTSNPNRETSIRPCPHDFFLIVQDSFMHPAILFYLDKSSPNSLLSRIVIGKNAVAVDGPLILHAE